MRFEPRGDRLQVEPDKAEAKTPGGIIVPDNAQRKERQGVIRSLGTGKGIAGLEVGYRVAYTQYAGTEIKIDGADLIVLSADDVIGVWCA